MKRITELWFLAFALCSVLLCGTIGCGIFGKGKLESGGAYAGNVTNAPMPELYAIDATFNLVHSALTGVFDYERNNRQALWVISPNIKKALDRVRVEASAAKLQFAKAREVYKSNPTPANLSAVNTALAKLQRAQAAALVVIPLKGH
jgi:hypothetical protein